MKKIKSHIVSNNGTIIEVNELEDNIVGTVYVAKYTNGYLTIITKEKFQEMEEEFRNLVKEELK